MESPTLSTLSDRARDEAENLRDDPILDRWMIAAYEEAPVTLGGDATPVCHIQGPRTSSQGVEVVPLAELAYARAEVEHLRDALREAREAIAAVHMAGFDSERQRLATAGVRAITAALKVVDHD